MQNSTIVANISGALPPNKKISGGLRSSLLMPVDFTMTEVKSNSVPPNEQRKFLQKSAGKESSNILFNGQRKGSGYLDHNKNQQVKMQMVNGNKNGIDITDEGVPCPKICLYTEKINPEWQKVHKIGAGLVNLGNTCFMNTVLQCLTYTPPLANYLLYDSDHTSKCKLTGFCMMCELQQHMKRAAERPGDVIKPVHIYQKLKSIAKHFQFGRQEDAHEFLRYVIDNLWKSCLSNYDGYTKLDPASKETTVINQIFGGYHRSQVTCLRCREKSNTYDHFMDFILDVKQNVLTLEKALEKFIQPELLQNDNAYKCPHCMMKVTAQKKFSVYKAPNVATFQFKRFDYHRMCGGKITKHISYPENLNLRPYMSVSKGGPVWYRLNAVLVHLGATCNSGHYFCYVKNSNGFWYLMDDSKVQQVNMNQVLNQNAYVLFYVRMNPSDNMSAKGPMKSSHVIRNGIVDRTSCASSHNIVPRPSLSFKSSPLPGISKLSVSQHTGNLCNGSASHITQKQVLQPLSQNRNKISFSVFSANNANKSVEKSTQKRESGLSANSPLLTKSSVNSNLLVPYNGDSSDSSDESKTETLDNAERQALHSNSSPLFLKSNTIPQHTNTTSPNQILYSPKRTASPIQQNKSIVIECRAKSRCSSNLKQSFNYTNLSRGSVSSPTTEHKVTSQNSCNSSSSDGSNTKVTSASSVSKNEACSAEECHTQDRSSSENLVKAPCSSNQSLDASHFMASPLAKINATSQWTVTDANLQSPSIASGSSTNSVNSTTDWNVIDQDLSRKKIERNSHLWSLHRKSADRVPKGVKGDTTSHGQQNKVDALGSEGHSDKAEASNLNGWDSVCSNSSTSCVKQKDDEKNASEYLTVPETPLPQDDLNISFDVNKNSEFVASKNSGSPSGEKDKEKGNCLLSGDDDSSDKVNNSLPSKNSNFRDQPFLFHRSESFRARQGSDSEQKPQSKEQDTNKRTFSDVSEVVSPKHTSRFFGADENSNGSVPKKFKKSDHVLEVERKHTYLKNLETESSLKDRHKVHSIYDSNSSRTAPFVSSHSNSNIVSSNSNIVSSNSRDGNKLYSTGSSMQNVSSHQSDRRENVSHERNERTRHKEFHSDACSGKTSRSDRRGLSSSSSSEEYEWVEKTKESLHSATKGSSYFWEEDRKQKSREHPHSPPKGTSCIAPPFRNSDSLFGTDVGTWDGSSRANTYSCEKRHKRYFDEYDEDLDKGKVRKKKYHQDNNYHKHNPFQTFQKNKERSRSHFDSSGRPKPHYPRNFSYGHPKERYYNRHYKSGGFKHFPRNQSSERRHFRHH